MAKNSNLQSAKTAKNDEFYTQLSDIENELKYYRKHFVGKVIYCNCDDARESNFFKFFSMNFEFLGLKKLIATGYQADGKGVKLVYEGDKNGNRYPDFDEIEVTELEGDGDFRSAECIEILKECDVVVTNPPFSLFREYVAQLIEYNKKFLIIGNGNAITYKEIFPLIKDNKLWLGVTLFCGKMPYFKVPNNYEVTNDRIITNEKGERLKQVNSIAWFTNLDHHRRNLELDLYMKYSNEYYPKYDNYDAIEVSKTKDIPMDYDGVMGVPITFLDKHCPEQFEILGITSSFDKNEKIEKLRTHPKHRNRSMINGKELYARILIKRK